MNDAISIGQLIQGGPITLIIGFLVWERQQLRTERKEADATRTIYDQARLEADKALASSMAALTVVIQSLPKVS